MSWFDQCDHTTHPIPSLLSTPPLWGRTTGWPHEPRTHGRQRTPCCAPPSGCSSSWRWRGAWWSRPWCGTACPAPSPSSRTHPRWPGSQPPERLPTEGTWKHDLKLFFSLLQCSWMFFLPHCVDCEELWIVKNRRYFIFYPLFLISARHNSQVHWVCWEVYLKNNPQMCIM